MPLLKRFLLCVLSLLCVFSGVSPAFALANPSQPPSSDLSDPALPGLEAFVDEFFQAQIAANTIPGAAISMVKGDRIVLAKGYGYADLEAQTPVVADRTLFRLGSVSKLITTTAALQQVEQNKLNLKTDINHYLKAFKIDNRQYGKITLDNLLNHTDGFDVGWAINAATLCDRRQEPFKKFLKNNLLDRVLPPDRFFLYGDVGLAIAGHLVEITAGLPFEQYVEKAIFRPLAMNSSTFLQPLPVDLAPNLAVGYRTVDNRHKPQPFTCNKSSPTTALSSTVTDMARFAIANLNEGTYQKQRILQASTVKNMHLRQYENFEDLPQAAGATYGFFEKFVNGYRAIEHGGSMMGHTSLLLLLPAKKIGFFIAYNTNSLNEDLREKFTQELFDRYFPKPPNNEFKTITNTKRTPFKDLQNINGSYRYIRYPRKSLVKLGMVLLEGGRLFSVKAHSDGMLTLWPGQTQWVEVKPLIFRYPNTDNYLGFKTDDRGKIVTMTFSNYPASIYEKLAWYEVPWLHVTAFGFSLFFFLILLFWNVLKFFNRKANCKFNKKLCFLENSIAILYFVFTGSTIFTIMKVNFWQFFWGLPKLMWFSLLIPPIALGLTVVLGLYLLFQIGNNKHFLRDYGSSCATVVISSLFLVLLNYWNLLGFHIY
jgi:CubicO group peptidase (beta-lactamase class C family)